MDATFLCRFRLLEGVALNLSSIKNNSMQLHLKSMQECCTRSKTLIIASKRNLEFKLPPKDVLCLALISSFGILKLCLEAYKIRRCKIQKQFSPTGFWIKVCLGGLKLWILVF